VTDSLLQSILRTCIGDVTLGVPLFPGPSLDMAWSDRCTELARASCRLSQTGGQEALILLQGSFSAPKVLHLLRCSPSVYHSALPEFDKLLRLAVERITNSSLTDSGFKPVSRLRTAVLVLCACHRPPFLPIWLRRRALLCSKLRSWPIAMFQKIITGRTIYSCGRHPEMRRQTPFL